MFKVGDRVLEKNHLMEPPGTIVRIDKKSDPDGRFKYIIQWDEFLSNKTTDAHDSWELTLLKDPNDILKELIKLT